MSLSLDRRRAIQQIGTGFGSFAGLGLLGGCESTDVNARSPSQLPLMDTDEAGLWKVMEKAEHDLAISPRRIRDTALESYVSGVVCRVAGDHCGDLRVYLIEAPFFNASMAPNGMMQVWTGALLRMENEAQLAAVVAHEAGHFIERHTLENFRRLKNNLAAATFFGMGIAVVGGGPTANLPALIALADLMSFGRDQERHADAIGLELMAKAGYAPGQVARVWKNEIAERDADPDNEEHDPFLRTHPGAEERMNTLTESAKLLEKPDQRVGAEDYQAHLRPFRESFLEDELQRRQPERTLHLLERLRKAGPEMAELGHYAGETLRLRDAEGDAIEARAAYNDAIRIDPAYAKAWRGLGMLERGSGHDGAARAAFQKYLELNPEAPDAAFLQSYLTQTS
jgi:predicted Zn-dependent protease